MKMAICYFLCILCIAGSLHASKTPCDLNDEACITKSFSDSLPEIVGGIPALGVKSSDPMYIETFTAVLSKLNYTFSNATYRGLKDCKVKSAKLNLDSKLSMDLFCPLLQIKGNYGIEGIIFDLPLDGKGSGSVVTENLGMRVDADIEKYEDNNGKTHIKINKIKLDLYERSKAVFDFASLNTNNAEIGKKILKLINENWLKVTTYAEEPFMYFVMDIYVANLNTYFEKVPINELLQK